MSQFTKSITQNHVRHGIKVGIASVLAYFVSNQIQLPYAYWAVITTVIVMQMHVADSIQMCVYRFTGTALGAAIGILCILIFPPTPLYTLLAIFIGTGVCAYLTRYNARYRMAAITLSIVFLTSLGEDHRIMFTLLRVAEIGIGVLCAFFVSVVIWPSRTGAVLRERVQIQYKELADHYALLMSNFLNRQQKTDPDLFFDLVGQTQENRAMFHKVYALERRFFRDDVNLLSLQVNVLHSVLERLQSMPLLLNDVEGDGFDIIMAPELTELTRTTSAALRAIGSGEKHDTHALAAAVDAIENRFLELRRQGVTERFQVRRLFQVLSFINASQHLGEYVLATLNKPELNQP
ncbi:FUSC family protein [Pseudodesulfovibrio sediminis]|uniref:FUSC family protein n=1 Tax=Pseudodesulfovibrio sediminis TaxID=2810563 RepID=A0ABN6EW88_9BACT|nr:FUSC family protein [Pseudodesulfovibrio sediminis]BCS89495.1 FUSC family protein [Pseudodesulfovibrio sediminis]